MERICGKYNQFVWKKVIIIAICLCVFLVSLSGFLIPNHIIAFAFERYGYAVLDVKTGDVILSYNENTRLPMASTTKIMTALLAVENCNLDEIVTVDQRSIGVEGSSVYLRLGERLTLRELLYCMMLRSGNDSATAIALHIANSVDEFAEMMNIRAESMGLTNTHFTNPHGLHDENHYTTAKELGLIACTAMKNNDFREIVGTKKITVGKGESQRTLLNKNKMLSLYNGATGIKTGYTKKSGRCLVSAAERDGKKLVCVVLNVGDTYGVSIKLLNEAFNR